MKVLSMTAAGCLLLGLLTSQTMATEKLRIGTEGDYKPFNYVTGSGEIKGFDYDIGQAVCAELKAECEWSTHEWSGIIPALQSGKFDIMIASMAINDERKKQVSFTNPYYFNAMHFIARKDLGIKDVSKAALEGKIIGTQSGSVAVETLKEYFPDNEVKLYPSLSEAFLDMDSGRLDMVLESQMALSDWLAQDSGACCEFAGKPFILDTAQGNAMALRTDSTDLTKRLNTALETIMKNGTYDKIRQQYFDFDIMVRPVNASAYLK
ncbi:transporter substrate-binding domain-containing protein [Pseudochrobactrum kiredjianiae]|uniref:Transporter substrate-binding domain-containing protein n=1 Tax=Pseudochrobactrum kiredjianiae TaxID=386305 RepID=A0ABW3V5U1_9HYPH|nr:transporter substrate-binding domain-containing protein [Pseudochrobactrum kiredjianiae]MDM7850019.1 transporter substrate-binding domain-containing protein [Pseudochrobactrum kiredjianiae]